MQTGAIRKRRCGEYERSNSYTGTHAGRRRAARAVATHQVRGLALERRPGRDDRRRPRLLLRVLDRAAAGHPAHDRRLDRRRRSSLRTSQHATHRAVRQVHSRNPAGSDAQLAESPTARRDIVSAVTLLLGATTVFNALEAALEQIWGARELVPKGLRGWIRTRILSFGLILAVGFLLLVSLSLSTALTVAARSDRPALHRVRRAGGRAGFRDLGRPRDRADRAHLSLHARAPHGMASDPVGRARHGAAVPSRTLGHRVVSRPLDAALGVRRCRVVRSTVAVAVLLRADFSARRGIHCMLRRRARSRQKGGDHATQKQVSADCSASSSCCWSRPVSRSNRSCSTTPTTRSMRSRPTTDTSRISISRCCAAVTTSRASRS